MNSLHTPAARRPLFACSQCVRWFFNRAGLKNHVHAKHPAADRATGQSQSPPAHGPPSPQQSHNEEHLLPPHTPSVKIRDAESINPPSPTGTENLQGTVDGDIPMTDDFIQPLFDDHVDYDNYDDYDHYGYQDDNNIFNRDLSGSASRSSTPISVPHSQDHERAHAHQQKLADDKYIRKTYHSKLDGESFLTFQTSLYLL
jgi:hypothetical protein